MKTAVRGALKECLSDRLHELRGKRMASYRKGGGNGDDDDELAENSGRYSDGSGSSSGSGKGPPGAEKSLRSKVASAENSANEDIDESVDSRHEELEQFMKKRKTPKVKREGSFAAVVSAGKNAGKKG